MKHNNKDGFTLIEIVLVIAIAGALFAAVFIALSGVWADERDNERRSDMMEFIRQLKNYQTNNARGALPGTEKKERDYEILANGGSVIVSYDDSTNKFITTGSESDTSWYGFYTSYLKKDFGDPDGPHYDLNISICKSAGLDSSCSVSADNNYTIYVVTSAICYGEGAIKSANQRNVAVLYKMEAGGTYCENT